MRLGLFVLAAMLILAMSANSAMAKTGLVLREGGHGLEGTGEVLSTGSPVEVSWESSLGQCSSTPGLMEVGVNGSSKDTVHKQGEALWGKEDFTCQTTLGGQPDTMDAGMREITLSHSGKVKLEGSLSFQEPNTCSWSFRLRTGAFSPPSDGKAGLVVVKALAKSHSAKVLGCVSKPQTNLTITLADNGGNILETTLG